MLLDGDSKVTPVHVLPFRLSQPKWKAVTERNDDHYEEHRSNNELLFSECQAICKHCVWIAPSPPKVLIMITLLYLR